MPSIMARLNRLEEVTEDIQVQMANINDSINKALQSVLPKVEALLSRSESSLSLATTAASSSYARRRDAGGLTPLHVAASAGHSFAVLRLVGAGGVHALAPRRRTALHLSAERGHATAARHLLAAGAQVDARDVDGRTPLMLAATAASASVAEVLLRGGADASLLDKEKKTALDLATAAGAWNVRAVLLQPLSNGPRKASKSTLLEAVEDSDIDAITSILQTTSLDQDIHAALSNVKDPCSLWAFEDAKPGILWSKDGAISFRTAARYGRKEALRLLLNVGVDVNSQSGTGMTALMWACVGNQAECCKVLIEEGAAKDLKDDNGNTAMHHAASHAHVECVAALLDAGANSWIRNNHRKTPFLIAREKGVEYIFRRSFRE